MKELVVLGFDSRGLAEEARSAAPSSIAKERSVLAAGSMRGGRKSGLTTGWFGPLWGPHGIGNAAFSGHERSLPACETCRSDSIHHHDLGRRSRMKPGSNPASGAPLPSVSG